MNELDTLTPAQEAMRELAAAELAEQPDPDTLWCTICSQPIPEARARRQTATCSEKCKNRLDTIREHQRASRKCPYCLHPATPEEREHYRVWRAERGDRQSAAPEKRDHSLAPKWELIRLLTRAVYALQTQADTLAAEIDAKAPNLPLEALEGTGGPENASDANLTPPSPGTGHSREDQKLQKRDRAKLEAKLKKLTSLISDCQTAIPTRDSPA